MTTVVYTKGELWCDSRATNIETGEVNNDVKKYEIVKGLGLKINGEEVIALAGCGTSWGMEFFREEVIGKKEGDVVDFANDLSFELARYRRQKKFVVVGENPECTFMAVTERGVYVVYWDWFHFKSHFHSKEESLPCGMGSGFQIWRDLISPRERNPFTLGKTLSLRNRIVNWLMMRFNDKVDAGSNKLKRVL